MPLAFVNSVRLNYRVIGEAGPLIALSPGARRSMSEVQGLAGWLAARGYRILLHDRRNTGDSDVSIEGDGSEFEIWADDLRALLRHLGETHVVVGGSSSGCRLSTIFTLRYPEAVTALIMMRVTGGAFAVERLAFNYYTQYIKAAEAGGMAAICNTDHFKDLISRNRAIRDKVMSWTVPQFVSVFTRWRENLEQGRRTPILGATEVDLRSIRVPTLVLPGNDNTHSLASGRLAASLIPGSELKELRTDQLDVDLIGFNEWAADERIGPVIDDFLKRRLVAN